MMRRRGFSLIELLISVGILALMAGFGALSMHNAVGNGESRSLATVVAEQLRLARQSAIATQQPVGVLLPSGGGSAPVAQSLYVVTGQSMAHVTRVVPYNSEYPNAGLFAGTWPLALGSFSIFPLPASGRDIGFSVAAWLVNPNMSYSMQQDPALVFLPHGNVVSNGVPFLQGAYRLVAAAGLSWAPASAPASATGSTSSLTYASAMTAGEPWTIGVTSAGEISMSSGLLGQDGSVLTGSPSAVVGAASPPIVRGQPASAPVVQSQAVLPPPVVGLPAGATVSLTAGERISLAVNATDSSGRDLYVQWSATSASTNSNPATTGSFASSGPERMSWDSTNQVWSSSWDWLAPLTAQPGDSFTFQCSLGDPASAMVVEPALKQVAQTIANGSVFLSVGNSTSGGYDVVKSNLDGSNPIYLLSLPYFCDSVSCCADGSKILTNAPGSVASNTGYSVYSGKTGTLLFSFDPPNQVGPLAISPFGNQVAYWATPVGLVSALMTANLIGTNQVTVYPNPIGAFCNIPYDLAWSPDQTQLAFIANTTASPGTWDLSTINATGVNHQEPLPNVRACTVTWAADSGSVYATFGSPPYQGEIYQYVPGTQAFANGGNPVTNTGGQLGGSWFVPPVAVSPLGTSFIFSTNSLLWSSPATLPPPSPTQLTGSTAPTSVSPGSLRGIGVSNQ